MTPPHLRWDTPTRAATHRGVLVRSPTDSLLVCEVYPTAPDDRDFLGRPVPEGSWWCAWVGGGPTLYTLCATVDDAKATGLLNAQMKGLL